MATKVGDGCWIPDRDDLTADLILPPPEDPDCWVELCLDTVLQPGDEYCCPNGSLVWEPILPVQVGIRVRHLRGCSRCKFRRFDP